MTISSLSNTADVQALQQQQQQRRQPPSMDDTAQLLGLSTDDLRSALKSGQTLDDLASAKGVSSADLTNAIKSDIQAPARPAARLRVPPQRPRRGPARRPGVTHRRVRAPDIGACLPP
jgi:hypothetical protein